MRADSAFQGRRGVDVAVAAGLAVGLAVLARACFQERMLVDGAGLATFFAEGRRLAHHFLYLPFCRLVAPAARLVAPDDPIEGTRIASAAAYGVAVGFTWLFVRALQGGGAPRVERRAALFATLLVALAPAAAFFATTVEVHAVHFAAVAFAAWATVRLPWRAPVLATAGAAALLGLAFWGHQLAVLLGPGWVALCGVAARRAGRPLSRRALFLGVGPALLAGLVGASALANYLRTGAPLPSAEDELGVLATFSRPPEAWRFGWDGWLAPLALVVPAAAAGLFRGTLARDLRAALAWLVGVPTAFLFAWGVAEYGGYVLGHAPFLALLAAGAVEPAARRPGRFAALALVALAVQAALAARVVRELGAGFDVEERVALVAEHLRGGTFLATAPNAPSVAVYLPEATEVRADDVLLRAAADGLSPEEASALLTGAARAELARSGRLVFDLGYQTQLDRAPIRERARVLDPVRAALAAEFRTARVEHEHWPLLVVEPRR